MRSERAYLAHNLEKLGNLLSEPLFTRKDFESVRAKRVTLLEALKRNPLTRADRALYTRLPPAQDRVDLPDQGLGARPGFFCLDPGGHRLAQLITQFLAALRNRGRLALTFCGRRTQSLDLGLQRLDLNRVGVLRRQKIVPPIGKRIPQAFEGFVGQSVVFDIGLDRAGETVEAVEIRQVLSTRRPGQREPETDNQI